MKLLDLHGIATADLPMAALRAHLRLSTGFGDDTLQDAVLEPALRAAIAAIEARTGKVLYTRAFRWVIRAWRNPCRQPLPVAPVTDVTTLSVLARNGDVVGGGLGDVVLHEDSQRPALVASSMGLPPIPVNGRVEIGFVAGFGASWAEIPADLSHAVMLLAAFYYEAQGDAAVEDGNLPYGVSGLIAPYRTVRILGGAGA